MAGSPDYVVTGRSNLSSPQIGDIRGQTEYAHKNGVEVEIVLNSSCLGGRQLTPAEKHAARDEYRQITKPMRHRRRCRADAIQAAWRRMCRRSITSDMGVGEFSGLYARRGKTKEMAGSSGRMYIRSSLPIYCQIGRMCELEFGYACVIYHA